MMAPGPFGEENSDPTASIKNRTKPLVENRFAIVQPNKHIGSGILPSHQHALQGNRPEEPFTIIWEVGPSDDQLSFPFQHDTLKNDKNNSLSNLF